MPDDRKQGNDNRDLGFLMGLDAVYDEEPEIAEKFSASFGNRKHIPKLRKKNKLSLWMREPDKYARISENFRTFAGKISVMNENKGWKIFLVTGSEESVGVSTITFNLGLIMGWDMPDRRILIADTNIAHPCLHTAFGHPPSPGLMEYLLDKLPLFEIVQKTCLSNLDIIPFCHTEHDILSPFSLKTFSKFMKEVREYYDFVLLDSAPVLSSSHTRILSSKADGVIIVAEAGRTRFEVLEELVRQLKSEGAKPAGSFLNKRRYVIPKWLYRYI